MLAVSKNLIKAFLWVFIKPLLVFVKTTTKCKIIVWRVDRLGHLALNTHLFFIRLPKFRDTNFKIISPSKTNTIIANKVLFKMFLVSMSKVQNINLYSSNLLYYIVTVFQNKLLEMGLIHIMGYTSRESEFSNFYKSVSFSQEQIYCAKKTLFNMNIQDTDKLVCVYARDSSYLKVKFPNNDWNYHNYRDSNIEDYSKAIEYLIELGYTVIRVGSEFSSPLNYQNDKYIEYNLSRYKSDLMDLYLCSIAKFIIGSRSGITDISLIFNVPLLAVNSTTFMESPLGNSDLFIQKKLSQNGQIIPFKNVIDKKIFYLFNGLELFNNYGITYIDNTVEEILEATKEMHDKVSGYKYTDSDIKLLKIYHDNFCKKNKWSNRKAPISLRWLKNNKDLYLN